MPPEFLAGDKIILEYEAGISENEHPRIAIDAVGYGYNHLHVHVRWPIPGLALLDLVW